MLSFLYNYFDAVGGYLWFSMFTSWLADYYHEIFHPKFDSDTVKVEDILVHTG